MPAPEPHTLPRAQAQQDGDINAQTRHEDAFEAIDDTFLLNIARAHGGGDAKVVSTLGLVLLLHRVALLDTDDQIELWRLAKDFMQKPSPRQVEEIMHCMLEILDDADQEPRPAVPWPDTKPTTEYMSWKKYVAKQIRQARKNAGLTQQTLSERTGIPQSHISRIENAQHGPATSTLHRIEEACGLPKDALTLYDGPDLDDDQ